MTNQELSSKIKEVESKIEAVKKEQTTLEVKRDQAKEKRDALSEEIKQLFGTTDIDELKLKKEEFISELEDINFD